MATDSQAFMAKALWILAMIKDNRLPRKVWPFHKDGDLWAMFHAHAKAKQPQAIRISKVKGHATDSMVAEGKATKADQEGNNHADLAADEGVALFGDLITRASKAWAERHQAYTAWVKQLWQHLIFTYMVREALLKQQAQPIPTPHQSHPPHHQTKPTQAIAMPSYDDVATQPTSHHFHFQPTSPNTLSP